MVAIKDMKMPKCCGECACCHAIRFNLEHLYYCCISDNDDMKINIHIRNKDCPLVEIKAKAEL